jgi:ABC-2 type transport system permease protein
MTRLVGAELRRLASRRMSWVAVLLLLLGVGLFQLAVNDQVAPPSAAEVAQNQQYLDDARQQWQANHEQVEKDCLDAGQPAEQCRYPEPTAADFGLAPVPFAVVADMAVGLSAFLALLASYLVAASSIGAEYTTGAIANWLTFVPQRLRVYASKLVAVVLACAALGAVVNFAMLGLAAFITRLHGGALAGAGPVAATGGRAVALAVLAGVVGFCLALVTRHTAAAVGLVLGYLVLAFVLQGLSSSVPAFQGVPPWMPDQNLLAFLQHGTSYYIEVATTGAQGTQYDQIEKHISFGHSVAYMTVVLVVAVAGSALVFRKRDVT